MTDLVRSIPSLAGRRTAAAVGAVVLLAGVAGCGSGGGSDSGGSPSRAGAGTSSSSSSSSSAATAGAPSSGGSGSTTQGGDAAALVTRAKAALLAAKSVQIGGEINSSDQQITLSLGYGQHGTAGSITVQTFPFSVIVKDGSVYFKAPDAFWKKQAGANAAVVLQRIAGRWIKAPSTDANFGQLAQLADRSKFAGQVLEPDSDIKLGADKTVDGVPCAAIDSGDGTLYVAKDDGRPIEIIGGDKDGNGSLKFQKYGQVTEPTVPPANQVVALSELGG